MKQKPGESARQQGLGPAAVRPALLFPFGNLREIARCGILLANVLARIAIPKSPVHRYDS